MKIYIKSSKNGAIGDYSDEELNELYFNIIDQREGMGHDNPRLDFLDDIYWDVTNEIGRRKSSGRYAY